MLLHSVSSRFDIFFFFQAEDGIRDVAVTGVQTCALPISEASTADNSSTASTVIRRLPPAPPWDSGMSMPMSPSSKHFASSTGSTVEARDRKSTRLNSSHGYISYAVFCLKKKKKRKKMSDYTQLCS